MEKTLKVDYTAPLAVGNLSLHTQYVTQSDGTVQVVVSPSWNPSSDGQSGIRRYHYKDQICNYCQWSPVWVDNGLAVTCPHCYSYSPGQLVHFSVIAENHAGLFSPATTKIMALDPARPKEGKNNFGLQVSMSGKRLTIQEQSSLAMHSHATEVPLRYEVLELTGKRLRIGTFQNGTIVDLHEFSSGVYLLRVMRGAEIVATEKILLAN